MGERYPSFSWWKCRQANRQKAVSGHAVLDHLAPIYACVQAPQPSRPLFRVPFLCPVKSWSSPLAWVSFFNCNPSRFSGGHSHPTNPPFGEFSALFLSLECNFSFASLVYTYVFTSVAVSLERGPAQGLVAELKAVENLVVRLQVENRCMERVLMSRGT